MLGEFSEATKLRSSWECYNECGFEIDLDCIVNEVVSKKKYFENRSTDDYCKFLTHYTVVYPHRYGNMYFRLNSRTEKYSITKYKRTNDQVFKVEQ